MNTDKTLEENRKKRKEKGKIIGCFGLQAAGSGLSPARRSARSCFSSVFICVHLCSSVFICGQIGFKVFDVFEGS
ncbi:MULTISPECIES: hypothetical protein [unclassified Wenzhouxiangella]|uniref:hypothetical protein n=1 Tax=unclassified Wenzhouxiangella TaxID=2613841 RepID=UPI0011C052E8|nr:MULTISPECIES: hypothetical protein [unclassified Wenzhouxiangella]